jgi:2-polyprenyl-3-methyl-5-hydroxy-6-metoxy-1,4-benzoquinol methylase
LYFDFKPKNISALDAQLEAQKIAFSPVIFQCVRVLKEWGILELLHVSGKKGLCLDEICKQTKKSRYAISVLLESALSAYVIEQDGDKFLLTKIGYFLQNDNMTIINLNYNHYINYLGMYHLDEALIEQKPIGLKYFGKWNTIYPSLSKLPEKAKKAWFEFDHFYSDNGFEEALEELKKLSPLSILDIGGNTGKFSLICAATIPQANICIADLPEQISLAQKVIKTTNMQNRITTYAVDVLSSTDLPQNYDIIWMSQFLDCFSEEEVLFILKKVHKSCAEHTRVCILEPIWDKQKFETSAFCIINTSPYFAAIANGKSKMFKNEVLETLISKADFEIERVVNELGYGHTLFICRQKTKKGIK